jgi:hypothetical protein
MGWYGSLLRSCPRYHIAAVTDVAASCGEDQHRVGGSYVTLLKSYILGFIYVEISKIAVT